MSRPQAALEDLTEQPGPGHTVMAPRHAGAEPNGCLPDPLRQPTATGNDPTPLAPTRTGGRSSTAMMRRRSSASSSYVLAPLDPSRGCGRSNWTPPTRRRDWAGYEEPPPHNNDQHHPPANADERRANFVRPLDTGALMGAAHGGRLRSPGSGLVRRAQPGPAGRAAGAPRTVRRRALDLRPRRRQRRLLGRLARAARHRPRQRIQRAVLGRADRVHHHRPVHPVLSRPPACV